MSRAETGTAARPPIFPFAPLFRGARPFVLRDCECAELSTLPVRRMTMIPTRDGTMPPRQIALDGAILSSSSWMFDTACNALSWQSGQIGTRHEGRLQFAPDLHRAQGTLTIDDRVVTVIADLPPFTYTCAVARNTGAHATGLAPALQLNRDHASASWNGADRLENALHFTYQVTQQTVLGQVFYDFSVAFADPQTGAGWSPADGTFGCLIDENFDFTMTLEGGVSPPPDHRSGLAGEAGQVATVFRSSFRCSFRRP